MYAQLQSKVESFVQSKCQGMNGVSISSKDFGKLQTSFNEGVKEVFNLDKTPRAKDFSLNPITKTITGSFLVPVQLEITLPSTESSNEATNEEATESTI